MSELTKHFIILLTIAVAVFFTNLGVAKLWDRDEPRNAGCASEMLQRGDWVVPIFNDELRAQKPVLLYWLMMSAYSIFGVNEFAARFWSALLASGTVFATYLIARRLFNGKVALLGGTILATTVMFGVAGRAATPDSLLIFCGTMALMIYVLGTFAAAPSEPPTQKPTWFPKSHWSILAIYFFLGLGTLAKGPIGFFLPMAIIGMFMLVMRSTPVSSSGSSDFGTWLRETAVQVWNVCNPLHFARTVWAMRPLTAIFVILLVAAPWYVWAGLRTEGDFLERFFLTENLARATTAMENHSGGLWFYPATLILGFFPWSVFALPVLLFVVRSIRGASDSRQFASLTFLVCWVCVQVGLFSIASTKLPSYVTPCYPALAILFASGLYAAFMAGSPTVAIGWYRLAAIVLAVTGAGAIAGMFFVANRYLDNDYWIGLVGVAPLLGGIVAYYFLRKEAKWPALISFSIAAFALSVGMFGFGTVVVDRHRELANVLEPMNESPSEVATYGVLESSWVFYAERRIFELAEDRNPARPTSLERSKSWKPKPWVTPESFAAATSGLILTTDEKVESLLSRLPGYKILDRAPYFLNEEDLVLVGPQTKKEPRYANQRDSQIR